MYSLKKNKFKFRNKRNFHNSLKNVLFKLIEAYHDLMTLANQSF